MSLTMMPNAVREAITLTASAIVPALLAISFHPELADRHRAGLEPGEVRLVEVRGWDAAVVWIDARSTEEYERDHIPGALHFDQGQFERDLSSLLAAWSPGIPIVVYCGSDACGTSRTIADQLRSAGLAEVFFLHGGWESWLAAKH